MKIYTKTGDKGMTGLIGGTRVAKHSLRIAAYGEVDELNAVLGCVGAMTTHGAIQDSLHDIQSTLFQVGAQLATPVGDPKIERINARHVESLERQIDVMTENLPQLTHFILPGGGPSAAFLHLARTVCRRAERAVTALSEGKDEKVDPWVVTYLNRLSDYLFTLARLANQLDGISELIWQGK